MTVTAGLASLATVDLLISQGADNTYTFRYSEKVGGVMTPVNLTGYTARAQIRNRVGGEIWLQLDGQIVLGADGSITVTIGHAATEGDAWNGRNVGVWDLELVSPTSKVVRFVSGMVTVSPDVTRNV